VRETVLIVGNFFLAHTRGSSWVVYVNIAGLGGLFIFFSVRTFFVLIVTIVVHVMNPRDIFVTIVGVILIRVVFNEVLVL
jgi:hypothetical protein